MTTAYLNISHGKIEVKSFTLTADASATAFSNAAWMEGWWITQVHLLASLDDAVTFSINAAEGGLIGTITTTAATSGEFMPLATTGAESRFLTGTPTYTLSGLGSGNLTVKMVLSQ